MDPMDDFRFIRFESVRNDLLALIRRIQRETPELTYPLSFREHLLSIEEGYVQDIIWLIEKALIDLQTQFDRDTNRAIFSAKR